MGHLLALAGMNANPLRKIELIPVTVRSQHIFHDCQYQLIQNQFVAGAGLQQHRAESGRAPSIEVTPTARRRSEPRLELATDALDEIVIRQALDDEVAVRTQLVEIHSFLCKQRARGTRRRSLAAAADVIHQFTLLIARSSDESFFTRRSLSPVKEIGSLAHGYRAGRASHAILPA